MAKKKKQREAVPVAVREPGRFRAIDGAALTAAILCIVLGYLTRNDLTPDGVAYLDLATAMGRGHWPQFVQGYWSPLLPFLVGAIGRLFSLQAAALPPLVHAINTLAALGAVALLWWWARRRATDHFGLAALGVFMTCSYGLPRIETVTPDVILLALVVWLAYELLGRKGTRWPIVGILMGLCFLAKTSSWPWLLLGIPLRLWAAADSPGRRRVLWSTALCAGVMALWIVPLSLEAGRPTLGSSGRLNYTWYFLGSTSGLPDRDLGRNTAYQDIATTDGQRVTLATFDDAANWTYQPWGDPTAWAEKVVANDARTPTLPLVLRFWGRAARISLGKWLLPLIAAVVIPALVLAHRERRWRSLVTERRDVLEVMVLGVAAVGQFLAVHSEPRLVAPGAAMLALAVVSWVYAGAAPDEAGSVRGALAWIAVIVGVGLAVPRLIEAERTSAVAAAGVARMRDFSSRMTAAGHPAPRIAVLGQASPLMGAAYLAGAHITAQLLPRSLSGLSALPREQQPEFMATLLRGRAELLWTAAADGSVNMWAVPAAASP